MLKIEYSPERVAFSQTECGICMDSYQEKDRIVELACKHIYHEDCVPESMVRCPKFDLQLPAGLKIIHERIPIE